MSELKWSCKKKIGIAKQGLMRTLNDMERDVGPKSQLLSRD